MKNISFWSRFALPILVFTSQLAHAGMAEMPAENDRIKLGFNVAYAHENRAQITSATTDASGLINPAADGSFGFLNSNSYDSYAIGAFLWLPMTHWSDFDINAVLEIDHTPGANVSAGRSVLIEGEGTYILDDNVYIKTRRTNVAAGLNMVKELDNHMFMVAKVAGGISRLHVRGENISTADGISFISIDGDHPGLSTTTPFVNGELAIGKHLTAKSHVYAFFNYTMSRRDEPIDLAAQGDDEWHTSILVSKHWYKIGLAFIREINL